MLVWRRLQERKEHSHSWPRAVKSLQCHATAPHARCRRPFSCPPPRKVSVPLPGFMVPALFLSSSSESLGSLTWFHGAGPFPVLLLGKSWFPYLVSWCRPFSCPPPRKVSVPLPGFMVPALFLSSPSESLGSLTWFHGAGPFPVLPLGKSRFPYLVSWCRPFSCPPPRKVSVPLPGFMVPALFLSSPSESLGSLTWFHGAGSFSVLLLLGKAPVLLHGFMVLDLFLSFSSESLGSLPVFMVPDLFLSYPSESLGSLPVFMVPDLFLSYPLGKSRFSTRFHGAGSFPVLPLGKSRFSTCFHGAGSFPVLPLGKSPFSYLFSWCRIIFCPPTRKVSVLYLFSWYRIFSCPSPRKVSVLYLFSWYRIFSCPSPRKVSVLYPFSWYRIFSCPSPRKGFCSVAACSLGPSDGHLCGIR